MQHEIDVAARIERRHGILRLVVPALRVAYDGEAYRPPPRASLFDTHRINGIDTLSPFMRVS